MSSDDEDRYPTIQHTRQRDLVEEDDDDVDIDDDEQYDEDMGDNNGDVMDGDEEGDDDEGDQRITAWGTQKKRFYREGDEDESEQAEEDEEEEAKLIEKLQQEQLSHENFFDVFGDQAMTDKQKEKKGGDIEEEDEEFPSFTLKAKFRSMEDLAESDKIALIQKESPELLNIIQEFKASLKELKYKFLPLISYLREKKTTMKEGQRYIEIKFNLLTSYCINLSFYILLNSQGKSVKDHPVIKKLISVKTSLARLKPLDKKLQGEINQILKSIEQEKELKPKKGKAAKEAVKGPAQKSQGVPQNAKKSDKNLFGDTNNGKKAAKNAENSKGKAALKSALKGELPSGKAQKELLGKRGIADLNKKSVKFAGDEDIDDEIDDDDDMEGLGDDIDDDFGGEGFGDEDDGEDEFYKKIKNMKKVKRDTINKEKTEKKKEQFKEDPRHYVGEESSRVVNRRIMKNKGLTRHRGKTSGNARIKHKNRFEKAQHKLKSKGIVVREKTDHYTGEKHISSGKIRSTKY